MNITIVEDGDLGSEWALIIPCFPFTNDIFYHAIAGGRQGAAFGLLSL